MIIRKETLQAAMAATATDQSRYMLTAVHCEPAASRVVATNGHVLLIATDNVPFDDTDFPTINGATFHGQPEGPVNIPVDVCKAMIGTMPKKTSIPILQCVQLGANGSPSSAIVSATDLGAPRTATIDLTNQGIFPSYDRVIPKADRAHVSVSLSVEVLETLIKACKAVSKDKRLPQIRFDVPIEKPDVTNGAVVSALGITIEGSDVTVTGCAMPCRL